MKKFIVLRIYSSTASVTPTVVFQTDDRDDARLYAEIMRRSDGYEYAVATTIAA